MALYGVRLVINLFDLCIYRRYLEEFIGNRKTSMEFSVLLLIVCELIGSAVNQMGISWLNFVTMVAILCVYVCQYEAGIVSRLIAVLLYMGIMGISEPAGYLFSKVFMEQIVEDDVVIYYFSAFLVVIFRLAIVEVFCRLKAGKNVKVSSMPKETSYALALIPLCSLISCFLLIEVAKELISAQMVVLCMCIIFVIIITNYIIFLLWFFAAIPVDITQTAGFSVILVPIWCCWFRFIHRLCFTRHRWQGCWQYCWCPQGSFFYSAPCTARTGNWIKRNKSILAEKQG